MPEDDLEKEVLTSSAAHLVNMLKEGRVSSEKIVDTFIQRIKKVRMGLGRCKFDRIGIELDYIVLHCQTPEVKICKM